MRNALVRIGFGIAAISGAAYTGYEFGRSTRADKLETSHFWHDIPANRVRRMLPNILDAAKIPHGDLSVTSYQVHSGRYFISQWQRTAIGTSLIALGKDQDGDICVAVGMQRGTLRHPQGYMEVELPHEDLTGLRSLGASRINKKTGELVMADKSIEDNAVREAFEEAGIRIGKEQLNFLSLTKEEGASPVRFNANYFVILKDTPQLQTHDTEFGDADLTQPRWAKLKDIKQQNGVFTLEKGDAMFEPETIKLLGQALEKSGNKNLANTLVRTASNNLYIPPFSQP